MDVVVFMMGLQLLCQLIYLCGTCQLVSLTHLQLSARCCSKNGCLECELFSDVQSLLLTQTVIILIYLMHLCASYLVQLMQMHHDLLIC